MCPCLGTEREGRGKATLVRRFVPVKFEIRTIKRVFYEHKPTTKVQMMQANYYVSNTIQLNTAIQPFRPPPAPPRASQHNYCLFITI